MAEDVNIEETADKLVNPAVETKAVKITDAIMDDREYKSKVNNCVKKICEVEIYPEYDQNIYAFKKYCS